MDFQTKAFNSYNNYDFVMAYIRKMETILEELDKFETYAEDLEPAFVDKIIEAGEATRLALIEELKFMVDYNG